MSEIILCHFKKGGCYLITPPHSEFDIPAKYMGVQDVFVSGGMVKFHQFEVAEWWVNDHGGNEIYQIPATFPTGHKIEEIIVPEDTSQDEF